MSRAATRLTHRLVGTQLSDPMSGFFMMRRDRFEEIAPRLSPVGFKILLDIAATAGERPVDRRAALCVRNAFDGESKFNAQIGVEFLGLLLAKMTGDLVDPRFLFFAIVGSLGLVVHLIVLRLSLVFLPDAFRAAQIIATLVAMTSNFLLNNELTYRDRRLKGMGHAARLCAVLPDRLGGRSRQCRSRILALLSNARSGGWRARWARIMGALWNYAMSTLFVWRAR